MCTWLSACFMSAWRDSSRQCQCAADEYHRRLNRQGDRTSSSPYRGGGQRSDKKQTVRSLYWRQLYGESDNMTKNSKNRAPLIRCVLLIGQRHMATYHTMLRLNKNWYDMKEPVLNSQRRMFLSNLKHGMIWKSQCWTHSKECSCLTTSMVWYERTSVELTGKNVLV